ncbi:MAG: glutamate racemase [Spirochaetota bacterium]
MDSRPIGIFDSGIGGLTVCKAINKLLPGENLIYFGDTARFPYGTRSAETLIRYARQITSYLLSRDVKMIVIACNTSSAAALPTLQQENTIPIIGVINAGARAACKRVHNNLIGVIGTRATVNSKSYEKAIHAINPAITVIQQHATLLVSLIEEGWIEDDVTRLTIQRYLHHMIDQDLKTLILGCTHFPILKNTIHEVYPQLDLVDTGEEIAKEVNEILIKKNLANNSSSGTIELYASDITDTMQNLKKLFFNGHDVPIEKLVIG